MYSQVFVILNFIIWAESSKLALWIDQELISEYFGVSFDISIIEDGEVNPLLQNRKIYDDIPPIPRRVDRIKLTWQGGRETYRYYFKELKSLDKSILYDPLLSIPTYGIIPHQTESFEVTVPCTEKKNGLARLTVALTITDSRGRQVRGSPLKITMSKECFQDKEKFDASKYLVCDNKCRNGGRCNEHGECTCSAPYSGKYCEKAPFSCEPACNNGGQCVKQDAAVKCKCRRGFTGKTCHIPVCRKGCGVNGKCVHNRCRCEPGWHGRRCRKRRQETSVRIRRWKLRREKRRQRHRAKRLMRRQRTPASQ